MLYAAHQEGKKTTGVDIEVSLILFRPEDCCAVLSEHVMCDAYVKMF